MKIRENELNTISIILDLLALNTSILLVAFVFFQFNSHHFSELYICLLLSNFSWTMAFLFIKRKQLYMKKGYRLRLYRILKRNIIFLLIETILLLLSWLYPLLAILIKISSKCPVIFIQKRTGINKVTFTGDDPRITVIGRLIRRTNIDELPQFFNVFKGEMSVVGPRPHMLKHTHAYSALINDYLLRHYVKPGLTGWAQINGFRGETDTLLKMEKRVEYDKQYIRNWTFNWDFVIVWKTIFSSKAFINAI